MKLGPALLAMASLGVAPATATVIFQNTGTTSGWSSINQEHLGTVQQVTNIVYSGTTAIKATQVYDPGYTGRYHSEVAKNDVYRRGDMGFYGFAFRLQSDWQFVTQSHTIAQFIGDFTSTGCDTWMPSTMIWLSGSGLHTRVKTGTPCAQVTTKFTGLASVTAGVWHRVLVQSNWQSDASGYFKLWYDGAKVLERYNIQTTVDDGRAFQFRAGLYANGWHDQGYMEGTQGTRQIWYDQIAAATTYAEANPSGW
jgi:polysaccharide lyase-like protein